MKKFKEYININEWQLTDDSKIEQIYKPQSSDELKELVYHRLKKDIKNPYLLDIDISKVKELVGLFSRDCVYSYLDKKGINVNEIEYIDISTWDMSSIVNMECLFYGCENLKEVKFSKDIDTKLVYDMGCMFCGCKSLKKIINISKFNTINVNRMACMFYHCESLEYLNLNDWCVKKLENTSSMFESCTRLKTIRGIHKWQAWGVDEMYDMFKNCSSFKKLPVWYDRSEWEY